MNLAAVGVTLVVILGGIVGQLYRARQARRVCPAPPDVRALQLACLATQALGIQFYVEQETFAGVAFILIGVGGLGALSFLCDCRAEALTGQNIK